MSIRQPIFTRSCMIIVTVLAIASAQPEGLSKSGGAVLPDGLLPPGVQNPIPIAVPAVANGTNSDSAGDWETVKTITGEDFSVDVWSILANFKPGQAASPAQAVVEALSATAEALDKSTAGTKYRIRVQKSGDQNRAIIELGRGPMSKDELLNGTLRLSPGSNNVVASAFYNKYVQNEYGMPQGQYDVFWQVADEHLNDPYQVYIAPSEDGSGFRYVPKIYDGDVISIRPQLFQSLWNFISGADGDRYSRDVAGEEFVDSMSGVLAKGNAERFRGILGEDGITTSLLPPDSSQWNLTDLQMSVLPPVRDQADVLLDPSHDADATEPIDREDGLNQRDDQRQQVLVQSGTLDLARRRAFNAVDVFFLADNTGSMGGEIAEVKAKAQSILDALAGTDPRFENVNIQWGVGRYSDDQITDPGDPGYELLQTITDDKAAIQAALNQWNSSWGSGTEAAFWAIQQAVSDGDGTPRHPANPLVGTGQATGWRNGAAKVIVLFGDEPSRQESINEKELRELLGLENVAVSIIDSGDSRSQNSGSSSTTWDATNGDQLHHAAEEITDGTGGAYIKLISTDQLVNAILAAVFDAIAENTRTGGQLTRITDSRAWRIRTPSSVEATTPDGGDTFDFTLRYPGETDSMFSVDLTSGAATPGKEYLETTAVTGADDLFGADLSTNALVQFTEDKDFLRFVFSNGSGAEVEGYYGDRLDSTPTSFLSTFDLSSRSISPYNGEVYTGGTAPEVLDTRMSINWSTGKVFAYDPTSPNPESGVGLFIGEVNTETNKVEGRYVAIADRETAGESGNVPRYIQDTARGNTNLQLYGDGAPRGIGGTFSVNWHSENGSPSYTSFLASGFLDATPVPDPMAVSEGETWQGFAAALVTNRSTGSTSVAVNDDASDVAMTFHPNSGEFEGHIEVEDGSTHTLDTAREDSAFVSSDAFGAVKDENGTPAHIATDTEGSSQYDYTSWGTWSKDSSGSPQQSVPARSPWIAGRLTPDGDVPTSGSATYNGRAWGHLNESGNFTTVSGDATLNANFGSRTLTGSFDDMRRANGTSWTSANVNAGWASGQNNIQGTINAANGMSGNVRGAFFGPNAEEVGGNWTLQGGGDKAAGAFAGKQ